MSLPSDPVPFGLGLKARRNNAWADRTIRRRYSSAAPCLTGIGLLPLSASQHRETKQAAGHSWFFWIGLFNQPSIRQRTTDTPLDKPRGG
jgi:hypothetical protein